MDTEKDIYEIIDQTQNGLNLIRSRVVGFLQDTSTGFRDEMILSISEDEEFADTVFITSKGAIQHTHGLPTKGFNVIMIPEEYGNFKNLLDKPFEWNDFHNKNFKKIV